MSSKHKKILITGADGFIGSHLVERCVKEKYEVKAFVYYNSFSSLGWLDTLSEELLSNIEIVSGDIRDSYIVNTAIKDVDVICHLAALIGIPYSYLAPESYIDTNVKGTLNVLQAARNYKSDKIIITSSSEAYGSAIYVPIDEKHPYQPQSPYSASKIAADNFSLSFFYSYNLPITIIRPFNTYGPRQSARAIIPTIITQIISNKKEIELGNLTPIRDFTYVLDLCEAYLDIIKKENLEGEIINIGSSCEISIENLVYKIKELMNSDIKIISKDLRKRPENSEVNKLIADTRKAYRLLNWKPKYSLDEGLKATIDWFKCEENLKKYKITYNI